MLLLLLLLLLMMMDDNVQKDASYSIIFIPNFRTRARAGVCENPDGANMEVKVEDPEVVEAVQSGIESLEDVFFWRYNAKKCEKNGVTSVSHNLLLDFEHFHTNINVTAR